MLFHIYVKFVCSICQHMGGGGTSKSCEGSGFFKGVRDNIGLRRSGHRQ